MKEKLKALLVQLILTCISYFIPVICMGGLLQAFGTIIGGPDHHPQFLCRSPGGGG